VAPAKPALGTEHQSLTADLEGTRFSDRLLPHSEGRPARLSPRASWYLRRIDFLMRIRSISPRPALLIAGLATILVLVDLGRRILATNDEARFALLGQDMLARGAWFFPQLNGAVYHAKPLLQAWLIALCSWPVGHVTQLTAVLPSALAAIGTVLVAFALGRSMFGTDAGWFGALVVMTTQGWFLHARLPMPDMLLAF